MGATLRIKCCCSTCCTACIRTKCYLVTFGGTFELNKTQYSPPDANQRPPTTDIDMFPVLFPSEEGCDIRKDVLTQNGVDIANLRVTFSTNINLGCAITVTYNNVSRSFFSHMSAISSLNCNTFDSTLDNQLLESDLSAYYTGGNVRVRVVDCNCTACPSSITAVVAGFTGACATYLNATYTLPRNGTLCEWVDNGSPVKVRLEKDGQNTYKLRLTASDGSVGSSQRIQNTLVGCPILGTFTVGFLAGGDCSNQTGTVTIS